MLYNSSSIIAWGQPELSGKNETSELLCKTHKFLVLTGNGSPEKPELLLEGRSRRAGHMVPFPALHGMIYQVVMKKKLKEKQVKKEITG